ncbi:hypothetical protein NK718_09110 [Alsobacter sp. SYSU M60028]|uniref:GlsB/YeaQ/YmgE family stress response membrane protein n=1 Tax=Alsobacter ponti TaxID=2962936 RepID=A0ABT1LB08_9HYPH|nr:hypothetical protein [Alsobacter ponti]MCP8938671.1 hypothetical protein [Alsobacter ponti]
MSVIRYLGLGLYSAETLGWILFVIACSSLIAGWVCDAVLDELGFGLFGNAFLCFIGMTIGLIAWNLNVSLMTTNAVMVIGIAAAAAFGCVFACAGVRRAMS